MAEIIEEQNRHGGGEAEAGEDGQSSKQKETEKTSKIVKKSLYFEESGETFSIVITLENVSPKNKTSVVCTFLRTIFERLIEELDLDNSRLE